MKKKTKYGINSGNSFRLGPHAVTVRYNAKNQYRVYKFLKNQFRFGSEAEKKNEKVLCKASQFVDDGSLQLGSLSSVRWDSQQTLSYSLNKKQRWKLPALVESGIEKLKESNTRASADGLSENVKANVPEVQISMVERELCVLDYYYWSPDNLPNSCVSYHHSALPQTHIMAAHKYAFEADLHDKGKCNGVTQYNQSRRSRRAKERRCLHNQHFRDMQRKTRRKGSKESGNDQNERNDNAAENQHYIEAFEENDPCVHYEICGPQKLLGYKNYYSQTHFEKFHEGRYNAYWIRGKKAFKKAKHYGKDYRVMENMEVRHGLEYYFQSQTFEEMTLEDEMTETSNDLNRPNQVFSLADALDDFDLIPRRCKGKTRHSNSQFDGDFADRIGHPNTAMRGAGQARIYGKGSVIYEERHEVETDADATSESTDEDFTMLDLSKSLNETSVDLSKPYSSVTVSLVQDDVTMESLVRMYGENHTENHTLPRSFTLKVTDLLTGKKMTNDGEMSDLYLLLEETKSKGTRVDAKQFRVHVDGDVDYDVLTIIQEQLSVVAKSASDPISLDSLVCSLVGWICDTNHVWESLFTVTKTRQAGTEANDLITKLQVCKASSHRADEACKILENGRTKQYGIPEQMVDTVFPSKPHYLRTLSHFGHVDYCDICYDNLCATDDEGIDLKADLDGLALASCQHWFCKGCWQKHLVERIKLGTLQIQCPAFECDEVVPDTLLLSLLPFSHYKTHTAHIRDAKLEQEALWKWCPNQKCGRLAKLITDPDKEVPESHLAANVTCLCGHTWCFNCQQEAHWPSTCTQATTYFKMVQQHSDREEADENKVFFVQVKKCPFCRHPIEKNGGCQHMYCTRCKGDFCWECLCAWSDHGATLTCPKGHVKETTMEIEHEDDVRLNTYYSLKALEVRKERGSIKPSWQERQAVILLHKIRRTQLKKSNPRMFVKSPQYWELLMRIPAQKQDGIMAAWKFTVQGMYLLEMTYVVLSKSTRQARFRALVEVFDRLRFIINTLRQLLVDYSGYSLLSVEARLASCLRHGQPCAQELVNKIQTLQKKQAQNKERKQITVGREM